MKDATHIYCNGCKSIQPCFWDELSGFDVSGQYVGTDIVCRRCFLIVATTFREKDAVEVTVG